MAAPTLYEEIHNLLEQQVQCVLATVDGEQPCLHLMAYGFSDSLDQLYLASYADTRKVQNMLKQPRVSLMWDNRTGQHEDHTGGLALNAEGKAKRLEGPARETVSQRLLARNPTLETLLCEPTTAVFAVDVQAYVFAKGYGGVQTYQP